MRSVNPFRSAMAAMSLVAILSAGPAPADAGRAVDHAPSAALPERDAGPTAAEPGASSSDPAPMDAPGGIPTGITMIMVSEHGCVYCARWDSEIGPIWPKTEEGRAAPLRRVDLRNLPDDVDFTTPPRLTPTFVLVRDGVELARMEGYGGDEFFWFLARQMLTAADIPLPGISGPNAGKDGTDENGS